MVCYLEGKQEIICGDSQGRIGGYGDIGRGLLVIVEVDTV
jgi:hypothetical protein